MTVLNTLVSFKSTLINICEFNRRIMSKTNKRTRVIYHDSADYQHSLHILLNNCKYKIQQCYYSLEHTGVYVICTHQYLQNTLQYHCFRKVFVFCCCFFQATITMVSICIEGVACIAAASVRADVVMTILSTLVSSKSTLINIYAHKVMG